MSAMRSKKNKTIRLWGELILIFFGLPLLIMALKERVLFLGLLWGGALVAFAYLKKYHHVTHAGEWNLRGAQKGMRRVLIRFAFFAPILSLWAWWDMPSAFLDFPFERPKIWIMVMLLYPVLSVWPQEVLFRSLIFYRYGALFSKKGLYQLVSAGAFGFAHIMLVNMPAFVLSFFGGVLFAYSYEKSRSLALVCFEHALYGCLLFTLGLGRYFYTGAAWG